MAIDAKISFMGQVERKCAEILTVSTMEKTMKIISDVLEGFDMRECTRWEDEGKDDLLDSYLSSMRVSGRSEKTINRYAYMIGRFTKYVNVPTRKINVYHIRGWLSSEKERGVQDSTLEGHRQILSAYFGWLHRESLIERNPMCNIGAIKVPKVEKETYSEVEMSKLMAACRTLREKAIISFLASTGCRVSEMVELNRDQVDLKNQEVVVHGKGNKERVVYFDSVTANLLERYLRRRKDKLEALFIGQQIQKSKPERLQAGGVRWLLNKIGKRAGVAHVHPHKFRRTLATEMARHGMPIQTVARLLGHEKIETTMEYVMLKKEDLKSDYRRYA